MKRVLIFAAYCKNGKIREDVTDLLRAFRPFADKILFVADSEADEDEQLKLKDIADYVRCRRHGEYDFGSYKHGWKTVLSAQWLNDADELVFCDDSCYAPVFPLAEMFCKMDAADCDFWGVVESPEIRPHLQSWFWAFRRQAFSSEAFEAFMNGITGCSSPRELIAKYEVPMTAFFKERGFKAASYIDWDSPLPPTACPVSLLKKRCPFVKRKVFQRTKYSAESVLETLKIVKNANPKLHRQIKASCGLKLAGLLINRGMRSLF